ncbi:MAG: hypothetical protein ACXW4P_30420 [Thermoanaerobaculia bacterium]
MPNRSHVASVATGSAAIFAPAMRRSRSVPSRAIQVTPQTRRTNTPPSTFVSATPDRATAAIQSFSPLRVRQQVSAASAMASNMWSGGSAFPAT